MRARGVHGARNPLDTPFFLIFRVLFVAGIVAGCYGLAINAKQASYAVQQKRAEQIYSAFGPGQPVVQTIQADRAYLTSLTLYASRLKDDPVANILTLRLRHPGADKDLAVQQFYLTAPLGEQQLLTFNFPPLEGSTDTPYELVIEANRPAGSAGVWTSVEEAYGDGTLVTGDKALPFDLSFYTYYRSPILEIFSPDNLVFFCQMLVLLVFILAVGFALLVMFGAGDHESGLDGFVAPLALGSAFPPVLFAIFSFASIKISPLSLALAFAALPVLAAAAFLYRWKSGGRRPQMPALTAFFGSRDWFFWSVAALLVYALLARAAQVQGLYVPNWIDGMVHQRALERIIASGTQPASQIYHTGFYSHAILTSMLTGLSTPGAMLVTAQLFSALGGVSFLYLASHFLKSRFAMLLSAVTYLFLAPFPSYLITWSRFPFMLGLMLLPAMMGYTIQILRSAKWRLTFPALLLFTGMALVHYGVVVIYLAFLGAWLLFDSASRGNLAGLFRTLGWRALAVLVGLVPAGLFLGPKLARFLFDPASRQALVDLSVEAASQIDLGHIFGLTTQIGGTLVWTMAAVGLVAGLLSNRRSALMLLAWYAVLGVATWAQLQLWGIAVASYADLVISLCIPLSLLAGFAVDVLFAPTPGLLDLFAKVRVQPAFLGLLSLLLVVFAGSYSQLGIVNPVTVFFSGRDLRAAQWIEKNTAPNAVVLIDSFRWGETYWPGDGGGWLKALTGRPVVYAHSAQDVSDIDALVISQKAGYIYLGPGFGELSARHFIDNLAYRVVYQEQGVTILMVKDNP